jgi:hypothetical protein
MGGKRTLAWYLLFVCNEDHLPIDLTEFDLSDAALLV